MTESQLKSEWWNGPFYLVDSLGEGERSSTISFSKESSPCTEAQNLLGQGIRSVEPFLTGLVFCGANWNQKFGLEQDGQMELKAESQ